VLAVTMPCFGTTHRTRSNAEILCDGKSAAEMPYQTFDNGIVTINTETAAALGFEGDKLDALKEAFKPYCTEIVEVTTAENFS
jgi:putative ABC transport system substrate-binding protein